MYKANSSALSTISLLLSLPLPLPHSTSLRSTNNLSINQSRALVRKVGHIAHNSRHGIGLQSLVASSLGLPVQSGLDAVLGVAGELDDGPALQAKGRPVLVDKGHVGGEVVVHFEGGAFGVEDLWEWWVSAVGGEGGGRWGLLWCLLRASWWWVRGCGLGVGGN